MADVELVATHADGDYYHSAERQNDHRAYNGAGVLEHSITASLTGADRIMTLPAFSARVPDGSGGLTAVDYAGGTVTFDAGDADDPRFDSVVLNEGGTAEIHKGTPTTVTGDVVEPPVPPINDDEILLAIVFVDEDATVVAASDVKGRAIDVTNAGGGSGGLAGVEVFTASGSFDATQVPVAADGGQWVDVELVGGGGGGSSRSSAGAGTGGGGGGYARKRINLAGQTSIPVTIGAGGDGGTSGTENGDPGGTTSFGSLLSATGGDAGLDGSLAADGGDGVGGDINIPGAYGLQGVNMATNEGIIARTMSGRGGDSMMGFGGPAFLTGAQINGGDGTGYGSGGAGGATSSGTDVDGGDGADGICIVRW